MSSDSGDLSDYDNPAGTNGAGINGHVNGFGNGKVGSRSAAMSEDEEMPLSQTVPPRRNLKRKKSNYVESSSDDDTPLASSPAKQSTSTAIAMPGAAAATTVPSSLLPKSKRPGTKKEESDYEEALSKPAKKKPTRKKAKREEDSSEDDEPIAASKPVARKRKVKAESDADSSDEDKPIVKAAKKPPVKKVKKEEPNDSPAPKANGKAKAKEEGEDEGKGKGKKKKKKEEEQEEVYRWWEADAGSDGSVKWQTLEHNGVIFPPPYDPLPSDVKMKYDGKAVTLPLESEEVAGFYAALIESDHAQDATFNKNFFNDWKGVLKKHPPLDGTKITTFEKCDFRPMFDYFESEKAKKKALTSAEKKELKKAKDDMELKYTTCLLDGRKEKVGNFRVEPPGLFRGRGEHPKKGSLKYRVRPDDIILNIGKDAPIPVPNMPGKWKAVQHDNTVTWLATWTENINQSHKYVFLAAGSSLKGQSDMMKFEKARELKNHVDRIRANYSGDLRSKVMAERQRATAMYFIDKLALRAGNEKGEDEADTVGCYSIRYYNRVTVDAQIFKNIRIFKENKNDDDSLFDRVTTASLNKHLNAEMKGLTAKVFRTYNASATFQRLLDENDLEGATLQEKLNAYNKANRLVAILCNHQRSVPKTHDQSMEKMRQKYKGLKYDRMKLRHGLFGMDSKYKKVEKYQDDESDIDDDWIAEYEEQLKAREIEKAEKKFAKENEKLAEDDIKPQADSILQDRIKNIEDEFKRLAKERGKTTAAVKGNKTAEKLMEGIDKLTDRIKSFKLQMVDRDEGKEVALGTSKINYLDPRITASWCKIHEVPIEKLFSKTLQVKFPWAMEVDTEWKF
ncbi:hypothetical protein BT96DRAFT_968891 [Gymnopus androsaceus JB14]|uniref:DNA topoisomerase 1 n=1 Tax=Gymnopus androsaceus JB14 TaxID=1447944 RepID=A0A6A4ILZ5_9AGAR|nr:hypothetical protein BT96DRAFT_968891 [Gymnopus androsaceus JB14]